MSKKYELTSDSVRCYGRTLYRIRALKDFGSIGRGDLGGFVESEANLDHGGGAWVSENAKVSGDVRREDK